MSYEKYEDEVYELMKSSKNIIVKDKINNKYFEVSDLEKFKSVNWSPYNSRISKKMFYLYFLLLIVLLFINIFYFFFITVDYNVSCFTFILLSTLYTLPQVMIHEGAHIICLKAFGKGIDKIGVKFNYIFPSIYVRLNDVYMLTNNEKLFVHSAGIMANLVINGICLVLSTIFNMAGLFTVSQFFVLGILMNVTPVLNSDKYKVLIGILGYNEKKNKSKNNKLISILGYVNIFISIVYSIKLIVGFLYN